MAGLCHLVLQMQRSCVGGCNPEVLTDGGGYRLGGADSEGTRVDGDRDIIYSLAVVREARSVG